jgi:hypothetical protein
MTSDLQLPSSQNPQSSAQPVPDSFPALAIVAAAEAGMDPEAWAHAMICHFLALPEGPAHLSQVDR